jgi:hypothetical protein
MLIADIISQQYSSDIVFNRAEANCELGAGRYYWKELAHGCADLPAQHIPGNFLGCAAVPHPEQIAESVRHAV